MILKYTETGYLNWYSILCENMADKISPLQQKTNAQASERISK